MEELICVIEKSNKITWLDILVIVLPIFLSTVAIIISIFTARQQNKIALFERRMQIFSKIKPMLDLYLEHRHLINDKPDDMLVTNTDCFRSFTNNSYLENIQDIIYHPLQSEYQNKFLRKKEDIKLFALESAHIFHGKSGQNISRFIDTYSRFLMEMYHYQIIANHVIDTQSQPWFKSIEESKKLIHEDDYRMKVLEQSQKLAEIYDTIIEDKTLEEITKQLRL